MRSHLVGLSVLAFAGLALAACSSSKGSSSVGGACAEYVAALKAGAQACGKYNVAPGREAELDARLTTQCSLVVGAPGSGLTPGLLSSCTSKVRAACGDDDACEDLATVGTLPDGAACGSDVQCASTDCKTSGSGDGERCGVCTPRVAIGGACGGGSLGSCVKGASCVSKTNSPGTCVARPELAEGDVCYDPKGSSSSVGRCSDGLSCVIVSGSNSAAVKCTRRGSAGAACASESACLSELACISGKCGVPAAVGAACTTGSDCATTACSTATKTCAAIEWVAAGAACDGSGRRCARGSCSQSSSAPGVCVDPIADGAACSNTTTGAAPRCDRYASCINGTCQIFDPATCK